MPLSNKEIECLLNLLNEDTCSTSLTFEQISKVFQEEISKSNYFYLANTLILFLQNRDLIPICQQRLIIFYLFNQMYQFESSSMDTHPFAPIYFSLFQSKQEHSKYFHWNISSLSKVERAFLHLLINNNNNNIKEISKKTPNEIFKMDFVNFDDKQKSFEYIQDLPFMSRCHLPAVINDPEINHYGFDNLMNNNSQLKTNQIRQTIENLISNQVMNKTIYPEYLRLVPPLHECTIDELVWLSPISERSLFSWDTSMCSSKQIDFEIYQIMNKAYHGAINLQEQQKLLDELESNPQQIHQFGLTPSKFPLLVENNPLISIQCLLKLNTSEQITDYLQSLVQMNMSLHSMEVVNRLSTSIDLPKEFLHQYILTCIQTCEQTKDKFLQSRFVRLVSVFIQSLIRNKVLDIRDLFLDVQNFSINFRQIKEATALFQLLKTFDEQSTHQI